MYLSSTLLALLALTPLPALAGSGHHHARSHNKRSFTINPYTNTTQPLVKRAQHNNARATWYVTDVAPGNCGKVSPRSGRTIALNGAEYHEQDRCWQTVRITCKGKTTTAVVADQCPSDYCSRGQIDMSEGLFTFFADKGEGVIYCDWDFVSDGGGDPDPEPPKTTKKTTTSTREEEETTSTSSRARTTTSQEPTTTSEPPTKTSSSVATTSTASSDSSASLTSTGTGSSVSGTGSLSSGTRTGTAGPAPSRGVSALAAGNNINNIFQLVVQLGEIASH